MHCHITERRVRTLHGYLRAICGGNLTEVEHFRRSFRDGFRAGKRTLRRPRQVPDAWLTPARGIF